MIRTDEFTRRWVGQREQLFNPETADPPYDWPDYDYKDNANWDYIIEILLWFGIGGGILCFIVCGFLFSLIIEWP